MRPLQKDFITLWKRKKQAASDLHRITRFSKQKEMENQHEAAGTKSDDGASYSP